MIEHKNLYPNEKKAHEQAEHKKIKQRNGVNLIKWLKIGYKTFKHLHPVKRTKRSNIIKITNQTKNFKQENLKQIKD